MALIEVYHVIADMYPVETVETTEDEIREGMVVALNASGNAIRAQDVATQNFIGLAGDSTFAPTGTSSQGSARTQNTPYSDPLVINGRGLTAWTQNRVSDPTHNETAASGLMTVYHGGGKFWTSEFVPASTSGTAWAPGQIVYASATTEWTGFVTNVDPSVGSVILGVCVAEPQEYSSGVPGTQTADGSMSLGTYVCIMLRH